MSSLYYDFESDSVVKIESSKRPSGEERAVQHEASRVRHKHTSVVHERFYRKETSVEIVDRPSVDVRMTQRDEVHKFEQGRIRALQEERLYIQKKTFTKWMNSFLQKARMEVEDLFVDLADGKKLLKLLEIISGEKLAKPNNGKMRVHKIENVNKSLAFLHTKVRLESIGAEDIVDGNPRLILGLIWTIILRFQIQEIEIDVDEENESSEKKSAKDALLLWCQRKTNGYPGVQIHDFTVSWRSGLGFNALIHSHRPDLFEWSTLQNNKNIDNLNHAFDVANDELNIPKLLDAEDVDTSRPDEKSVITYVASYYHTFARMKNEMKGGRRIANIVGQMMDADKMKLLYEKLTTRLLEWIKLKIDELDDREFPNSMEGIQTLLIQFGQYRTVEKPPKYKERSDIEALYFNINTQLKSLRQNAYSPPEGKLIHDIEKAWQSLERAEHRREVALRKELLRQERLEQLNYKFEKKSVLREGFLKDMIQVLSKPGYGSNLTQVDASVKKHEAISADILARKERFHDLTNMSDELVRERYHSADRVKQRETEVLEKWNDLLALLDKHKSNLSLLCSLMSILREIETTMSTIDELEVNFQSSDVGNHLLAVEDLRQNHSLQELQVAAVGETVRRLTRQAQTYINSDNKDATMLQQSIERLQKSYDRLIESGKERKARLEEARGFYQFIQDQEDEEAWLIEKQRICKAGISAKDLRAVLSLQQKHKTLQDEMNARRPKIQHLCEMGDKLVSDKHPRSNDIKVKIDSIQNNLAVLEELAALRRRKLEDAAVAYQFYTDANEADSWLNEKMALIASNDYGIDEPSAQALLQRHKDLEGELHAYVGDVQSLNSQADKLVKVGISTLELTAESESVPELPREEWVQETRLVPTEIWEEEPVERVEYHTVQEERSVPQVKALYPYTGKEINVVKNEVMFLLNKANDDWWSVRKADGIDGFVPANYVKEIEPRIIVVQVRKPEKITTMQRVKKTKMVKQVVPVKRVMSIKKTKPIVAKRKIDQDNENVEKRLKRINETYESLKTLAQKRRALLEDSICLYAFFRECDDFEKWIKDKERLLKDDEVAAGGSVNVEAAKRKFEKFLTDLSASSKRIESLDTMVNQLTNQGHSQLDKIRSRQRQIHQIWDHLNRLKTQKERSLEGASSVELYYRTCDEAKDWMNEKMTQLDTAELGPDLRTVQALQRRHQNLERELAPLEEKVNRVDLLANSVMASYPHEKDNVDQKQGEIFKMWQQVKTKAVERRSRLENAVGQQVFVNGTNSLLNWVGDTKDQLKADVTARDVETAENLKKKNSELLDDIRAHEDEVKEVKALGQQLIQRNISSKDVKDRLDTLLREYDDMKTMWAERENWLQQCLDLQLFNREADQIDATTSSHEAFLELSDLGTSLDDVEALLKRHEDFENTLFAQDERLRNFSDVADKLIEANHYDGKTIAERRDQVIARRLAVKNSALKRRKALLASKHFQEFCADVEDLNSWITEKSKTAADESYRDLNNLERKLQKHEAFERELHANEGQLRNVNKTGQSLISQNSYRKDDVAKMIKELNDKWEKLTSLSLDKGRRLRQASAQHGYNRTIDDARVKLEEIEKSLRSTELGHDLRSCKQYLKKHQILENDILQWQQKIDNLVTTGEEMAHEGHFDAVNILRSTKVCQDKFKSLHEPLKKRREVLEESLRFHKFCFELDTEMQWINEHLSLASSGTVGQNLYQAQSLHKKHQKLLEEIHGHRPMIDRTLAGGQSLCDQGHPEKKKIEALCDSLESAWKNLLTRADERAKKLDLSLKAQEFFFEACEVESWLNERTDVLSSSDYGRDRDAATKLLTKHKAIELELDTYNGIVTEMGHTASNMSKHPEAKAIAAKHQLLSQQLRSLQRLATVRQQRLMESMYRHEYFTESAELEQWIKEQEVQAASEDYGQDYEHLLLLQAKFDDFKHRVEAGSERYKLCEELAQKLITNESPYMQEIEKRQSQLRESWQRLQNLIKHRTQRLDAAAQIHRYHRDVAELLARIQQKHAELGTEPGRDLHAVLALLRRHEGFENDLVALDAQLQILIEDAVKLEKRYPSNATAVQQQRNAIMAAWNDLQSKTVQRKEILEASSDLHKFLAQVRDYQNWSSNLRATMTTEVRVRDAAGAQLLKSEHDAIKNEIEAREDTFNSVMDLSEAMIQTGHYAASDVEEKRKQLLSERKNLLETWEGKKYYLDQLIDLHLFLRDAKQIDTLCSTQEAALNNTNFGGTVDEVLAQEKKHDAFEKLLQAQDEKVTALQYRATNLINQNHFESDLIKHRLGEVLAKRQRVKQLCSLRRRLLDEALLYAQFNRDVTEANLWIGEKQKKLEVEANKGEVINNLEDKVKALQKHQAFQAELTANEGRIREIKEKGDMLLAKKHKDSPEIHQHLKNLLQAWNQLLLESNNRGRGLEEAQDILEFNNQLEKIEAWIRDKDMMVQANDTGKDYEHCLALQRKLDDVDSDMRVDDQRMKTIDALADKLVKQGEPNEVKSVRDRHKIFTQKCRDLHVALAAYRSKLAAALEVHSFNRNMDDTSDRISEKVLAMNTDDVGKDLAGVEILLRKQETLERDITVIDGKLRQHENEAKVLCGKYPEYTESVEKKLKDINRDWFGLLEASKKRKQALDASYDLHKFKTELRDLEIWITDAIKRIHSLETPNTMADVEASIALHGERKAEIDGRHETFKNLRTQGEKILGQNDNSEVKDLLHRLDDLNKQLYTTWEKRKKILTQAQQLQQFKEQADHIDGWLSAKEAFLNNDDLGDSLTSVETLLKKHEDFEKMLHSQLNRIVDLDKFVNGIVTDHYDSKSIRERLKTISTRTDRLLDMSKARAKRLNESKQMQQFLRNLYEVENWMSQKLQIATDENYRDASNLQSKIQKHIAFDAELNANKNRIESVMNEGEDLVASEHFDSEEIQQRVDELDNEWTLLREQTQMKRSRLDDAYQASLFNRALDEFETWMDEVEVQLKSDDHGKDLASVTYLLKKHTTLENDVLQHAENYETVKVTLTEFKKSNHFMFDELNERAQRAIKRYQALQTPLQSRRDKLEDAVLFQQFIRDVNEEMQWLKEKESAVMSNDLGSNLNSVQSLQKKHQTLESELVAREPSVSALLQRAQQMKRSGHFCADEVDAKSQELNKKLCQLRDYASVRKLRLLDAVESQMFYTEADEAVVWITEKRPIVASMDYGKDEDSVHTSLKKLDTFDRELKSFQNTVQKLANLSSGLIERNHFDSENIKNKQAVIESEYSQLCQLSLTRAKRLQDALEYLKFVRQSEELQEWIVEQSKIADSEDYGTDVEHIELLIQAFETFYARLVSNENAVLANQEHGKMLIEKNNPDRKKIQTKLDETQQMWEDLKDLAQARQEALFGAKQVHVFDRTADETIAWIAEKESSLVADYSYGQDLESIQTLIRQHQGFEADLGAVRKQVESVAEEASRLADLFPDAREHVEVKNDETYDAWNVLLDKAAERKNKLKQAETLQAYFNEYRDLMAWTNEIIAKITSPELAQNVEGAEALITRHSELKTETDTRNDQFASFFQNGEDLIKNGHFLANEIQEKIGILKQRKTLLHDTWEKRRILYEENLDTQIFKRDAESFEKWLISREVLLNDGKYGDSLVEVEEMIRRHEDFEKTIEAQEERVNAIKRITLLEKAFKRQKQDEETARLAERERVERERIEARKRKEMQRITEERYKENGSYVNGHSSQDEAKETAVNGSDAKNATSHVFGERLRSKPTPKINIKRAESMKVGSAGASQSSLLGKLPKRTPSFTTRRRTQSFRKANIDDPNTLPPVDMEGFLDRKQLLVSGGKKSPNRSWKNCYTVLCGQLMCFFKNKDDFVASKALYSPVVILNAQCLVAVDYLKRKHTFKLICTDHAEYLFTTQSDNDMYEWINKVSFHAKLPPSQQLLRYDEGGKSPERTPSRNSGENDNDTSVSSQTSSPDSQRRHSVSTSPSATISQNAKRAPVSNVVSVKPNNVATPPSNPAPVMTSFSSQTQFLQQHQQQLKQQQQRGMLVGPTDAFIEHEQIHSVQSDIRNIGIHPPVNHQIITNNVTITNNHNVAPQSTFNSITINQMNQTSQKSASLDYRNSNIERPPIPPRGAPPPVPVRGTNGRVSETLPNLKNSVGIDYPDSVSQQRPLSYHNISNLNGNNLNQSDVSSQWNNGNSFDVGKAESTNYRMKSFGNNQRAASFSNNVSPSLPARRSNSQNNAIIDHYHRSHSNIDKSALNASHYLGYAPSKPSNGSRPISMPPSYVPPPSVPTTPPILTPIESSSSELPKRSDHFDIEVSPRKDKDGKEKDRKILGLFSRKKRTSSQL